MHTGRINGIIELHSFLYRFNALMVFTHIVKFATFCHCKCHMDGLRLNNRFICQFRLLCRFLFPPLCYKLCIDLLLLCLLLQVSFHLWKISLQCSGSALCNRVNIYLYACNINAVLMKHIEKVIFSGGACVFHNHIQIRVFLLNTSASAPGYHYIHDFRIQTVFINLRLHISIHCFFYIVRTLSVQTMKQFFCLCPEICNHIRIVLSEFCLLCFQICLFHFLGFLRKFLKINNLCFGTCIHLALQKFITIILLCDR